MGRVLLISFLIVFFATILGVYKFVLFEVPPVPKLDNTYWGPGTPPVKEDRSIRPFKINVPDEIITDLRYRLKNTKPLPPALEGSAQNYGTNSKLTKQIVDFWLNNYNWKERERFLNKFPQFKTKIQGLDIHFLHVKPNAPKDMKVIPLLILHGWPGSVREFYEIIPLLTTPQKGRSFVYEVIAPSLPGYGFSDPAVRPGLGAGQIAVVMRNLMARLKINRFVVQGGDWGSIIAPYISLLYPENVIALHSNMCSDLTPKSILKRLLYSLRPSLIVEPKYEHLMYPLSKIFAGMLEETGYFHIQATKPDTIGTALTDSPAGLAAYIIEKFVTATNRKGKQVDDGNLSEKWKFEDLLDNIMIYWISGSITTSMRIYAETANKNHSALLLDRIPIPVPTGCARFVHDILYTPTALLYDKFPKLIHVNDYEGGHFAAFELSDVLAEDIYDFTEKVITLEEQT